MIAPGRHPAHLDAVLDDPEKLSRAAAFCRLGKIGRLRIEPLGNVAFGHARRAVTDGAMGGEVVDADRDLAGSPRPGGTWIPDACALIERTRAVSMIHCVIRQWGAVADTS
jgi:hypothetical protein